MLFNPSRDRLSTFGKTRLVTTDLGLIGHKLRCPRVNRIFTITQLFAPVQRTSIGGLRARVVDVKGFSSFINQRDLEVLLGVGSPDLECAWLGKNYVDSSSSDWGGFALSPPYESEDDMLIREMEWIDAGNAFAYGASLQRRVHQEEGKDVEEEWLFLSTKQLIAPEDVGKRWTRSDSQRVRWNAI